MESTTVKKSKGGIEVGNTVRYKVGRGYGKGTVAGTAIDGSFVEIDTPKGKRLRRKTSEVTCE